MNSVHVPGRDDVYLSDVVVKLEAGDKFTPAHYSVSPVWAGVDRPVSSSWSAGSKLSLANRLKRAVEAGAAIAGFEVRTDVNGKTYVEYRHVVSARRLNADLKKLGF